jgi:hypothetical protein
VGATVLAAAADETPPKDKSVEVAISQSFDETEAIVVLSIVFGDDEIHGRFHEMGQVNSRASQDRGDSKWHRCPQCSVSRSVSFLES